MSAVLRSEAPAFVTSETRREYLLRAGRAAPRFLQGVYPFAGRGIFETALLHDDLSYTVPEGATAEIAYFRAGNASDDLIYIALSSNDRPLRFFPLGPKANTHVELAIVESHATGTRLSVRFAAPRGLTGAVILDVGLIELREGARE
jgi:assimilatory nitrate reductase catalytic subunit